MFPASSYRGVSRTTHRIESVRSPTRSPMMSSFTLFTSTDAPLEMA